MRVRMKVQLSGLRNGQDWPPRGGECDLPDDEARSMIHSGMVEPVEESSTPVEESPVETAAVEDDSEKAVKKTTPRKRTGLTKESSGLHQPTTKES